MQGSEEKDGSTWYTADLVFRLLMLCSSWIVPSIFDLKNNLLSIIYLRKNLKKRKGTVKDAPVSGLRKWTNWLSLTQTHRRKKTFEETEYDDGMNAM